MAASAVSSTVLFGQADTIKQSMNECFRRTEHIGKRAQQAFKITAEHTLKEVLDSHKNKQAAPPPAPPTWRDAWLIQPPTVDELLLATHVEKASIAAETVALHADDRRKFRSSVKRQVAPSHRPPPPQPSHRKPPPAPAVAAKPPPRPSGASQPQPPQSLLSTAAFAPQPPPSARTTAAAAAAASDAASASVDHPRRAPPSRPAPPKASPRTAPRSARASPRHAASDKAAAARAKLLFGKAIDEPPSVTQSIMRREDLHALLYDVAAKTHEAERAAAATEREALQIALGRSQARAQALAEVRERIAAEDAAEPTRASERRRAPPTISWAPATAQAAAPAATPEAAATQPAAAATPASATLAPAAPAAPAHRAAPSCVRPPSHRPPPTAQPTSRAAPPVSTPEVGVNGGPMPIAGVNGGPVPISAPAPPPMHRRAAAYPPGISPRVRFHVPQPLASQPPHAQVTMSTRQPPAAVTARPTVAGGAQLWMPAHAQAGAHTPVPGHDGVQRQLSGGSSPRATKFASWESTFGRRTKGRAPVARHVPLSLVGGQPVPPPYSVAMTSLAQAWGSPRG